MKRQVANVMGFLVIAVLGWGAIGVADAQEVTWRIAHTPIPNTAYDYVVKELLPKRLASATNGRLKVEILPGVVNVLDILDAVKAGRVDGGSILSTGYYGGVVPKWDVTSLPGLIANEDVTMPRIINDFLLGAINKESTKDWNSRVVTMAWWARVWGFSKNGVGSTAAFKGLKYRTHSLWATEVLREFGASSVSMPFGELSSALQRGIVDATTSAIPPIMGVGLDEVVKHIDPWPFGMSVWMVLVNEKAIAALPEGLRSAVLSELARLSIESQKIEIDKAKEYDGLAEKRGMKRTLVERKEIERFVTVAQEKVWPRWVEKTGQEGQAWLNRTRELQAKP